MKAPLSVDLWTVLTGNAEDAKTLMGFMLPLQFLSVEKRKKRKKSKTVTSIPVIPVTVKDTSSTAANL